MLSTEYEKVVTPPGGSVAQRYGPFTVATVILIVLFAIPLGHLASLALNESLYSHILLIPFVTVYLIFTDRKKFLVQAGPERGPNLLSIAMIVAGLAGYAWAFWSKSRLSENDFLSATILSFLVCFVGIFAQFLGRETVRLAAFPVGFLIFMVPFPDYVRTAIETFMQQSSAVMSEWMFRLSGMAVLRDHLLIQLPGFRMQVAPECSGIHSSWVLFITSCMAGYMFLRTPWKRVALAAAVLPLAIIRNGFRIFVIGQLCVRVGPHMIDSPIHHRGGPLFFALSLVPFFIWLLILRRTDRKAVKTPSPTPGT